MLLDLQTSHVSTLERMSNWHVSFDHFFDVGAAKGMWGPLIRKHWPGSSIFFFEAAPAWEPHLREMAGRLGGRTEAIIAAIGDRDGEAFFRYDPSNPYGGALIDEPSDNSIR